jgi:hypothetical protein
MFAKSGLHRMQIITIGNAFDRCDFGTMRL